jgi:hypothetical protein
MVCNRNRGVRERHPLVGFISLASQKPDMGFGFGEMRNVGGIDRIVRAVLAVGLLGVGAWGLFAGETAIGAISLLAGAGLAFNAVTQFCVANHLLGVDTCSWGGAEEAQ